VVVSPTSLTIGEPAGSDTFTLRLTSEPTATVTINLSSSDTSECTVPASASLTTVNWQTGVTVTVSAVDDAVKDGSQPCTIQTTATSTDPVYNGATVSDVTVTVTDDDSAGVVVSPTSLTIGEPAGSDTFTLRLTSEPTATVTINLSSSDTSECTVPASASLTTVNWQTGVTVTVSAVDDAVKDGSQPCTIQTTATSTDPVYNGATVSDVTVTVTDDDSAGVVVSPTSLTIGEPAGNDTFTLRLTSQPTATVTVALSSSDTGECTVPVSASLTPVNWQTGVTVTVNVVDDAVKDGSQPCTADYGRSTDQAYDGATVSDVAITVTDDDRAGVVVSPTSLTIDEPAGSGTFNIRLTSQPTATVTIALTASDTSECTVPVSASLTTVNWQTGVTVTVNAVDDAIEDGSQPCAIQSTAVSNDPFYNTQTGSDVVVIVDDNDNSDLNSDTKLYLPNVIKN
jgi:hypothetical protein